MGNWTVEHLVCVPIIGKWHIYLAFPNKQGIIHQVNLYWFCYPIFATFFLHLGWVTFYCYMPELDSRKFSGSIWKWTLISLYKHAQIVWLVKSPYLQWDFNRSFLSWEQNIEKPRRSREFSGSPVGQILCFHCQGHGFDPWSGS